MPSKLDDILEFSEGQILVMTLPHGSRRKAIKILANASEPRRWGVARGQGLLYRGRGPAP